MRVIRACTAIAGRPLPAPRRGAGSGPQPGPGGNEPRAPAGERGAGRRRGRLAAALLGLAVIGAYLAIALSRLSYPFTIEWLESNSLVEVHRILAGRPLYTAPCGRLRA